MELNDLNLEEAVERFHAEAAKDFDANYVYVGEAFYEKSTDELAGYIAERRHGWTFCVPGTPTEKPTYLHEKTAIDALRSAIIHQLALPQIHVAELLAEMAYRPRVEEAAKSQHVWWEFWKAF